MKRRTVFTGCMVGLFLILISLSVMYLGLAYYYKDGFSYGTWINGIYCTGRSINEVNEELLKQCEYQELLIIMDGESHSIPAEELELDFSYKEPLELYRKRQNPYLWIDNMIRGGKKTLQPVISYNQKVLEAKLNSIGIRTEEDERERVIEIRKGDEGYYLVNEREHVLNGTMAKDLVCDAVENLKPILDLNASGCFSDLPLSGEMKNTLALWEQLSEYQDCKIIYQMGEEQIPVDKKIASNFLLLDDLGNFVLDAENRLCTDEEKIYAFVDELADRYDTVGKARQFHATRGEYVTVEGGIYGNELDREAEKAYLLDAFLNRKAEIHTPSYLQMAKKQGIDDIGDTYIEVDMTEQMLYYYVDGRITLTTPVVTGNTSLRRGTPGGTNYIYSKQRNRTLRGADYETFVKYWMPVNGNIGIHDASWRREFGGKIYERNGSHGCVNIPTDAAAQLYDAAETGTPCIMFY